MSRYLASRPALPVLAILALLMGLVAVLATPSSVRAGSTELIAELSGANEFPGPGDDDGFGFASVQIDASTGEVCVFIEVLDIAQATMAHIHAGAAGVAGDVVVTLPTPGADGFVEGCVDGLDAGVLQAIIDDPAGHYVNVHNADFIDGALRGQLQVPPPPPVELFAQLDGASEVPGPGDPDGNGFAALALFLETDELCISLAVEGIAAATMAHVHAGAAGAAGGIVVTLPTPDADGFADGCVAVDSALLDAIAADPAAYYVNVHNADFPDGAVRGQLSDEPPPPPQCPPGQLCIGDLAPGTYTFGGFGTDMTFTTTTVWFAFFDDLPSLALIDNVLAGGIFTFGFEGAVYTDPCDPGARGVIGTSPADVIAWLTERPFMATSAPVGVTYGGASGLQIDVSAVTLPPDCETGVALLFPFGDLTSFFFEEGSVARVIALDVNGETILLIAESFPGGATAEFLARAQGVVDSIVWSLGTEGGGTPPPPPATPTTPTLPDTAVPAAPVRGELVLGVLVVVAGVTGAAGRSLPPPSSFEPRN